MALLSLPRRLLTNPSVALPQQLKDLEHRGEECAAELAGLKDQDVAAIWRATKGLYRTGMSPAISLALRRRGELFINRAIGYRSLTPATPIDVNTPICLFSASKAVTGVLIHYLAEQGALDLNKPVAHYVPEYATGGKERSTILQVLTHRGGVPRIQEDVDPSALFDIDTVRDMMRRATARNPGREQAYHAITAGFVLGEVIERVTGECINVLLDKVIRQPMGMTHFSYGLADAVPADNVTTGLQLGPVDSFLKHAVGGPLQQVVDVSNDPRFRQVAIPAGNLYATAEEASRFFQMLLNGGEWQGKQILQRRTVENAVKPIKAARFDRTLLIPLQYSAGFMLGQKNLSLYGPGTPRAFGHLGFISIYCWADPQRDLAGALLTTGKGIIGPHLPALVKLQMVINRHCLD